MSDLIYIIIAIPIVALIYKLYIIPTLKIYQSVPISKKLTDDELSYDFKIRHGVLYLLIDMLIAIAAYIAIFAMKNQETLKDINKINFNPNNIKPAAIIIMIICAIVIISIPVLFIKYLITHHKRLKEYNFEKHSRIGVELAQFIIGITSFWTFPIGVGVKLGIYILIFIISSLSNTEFTKSTTYYRDSKGELKIATTFTDKETGSSETYWRDSSGKLHSNYTYKK